jgi:hypothetical protein
MNGLDRRKSRLDQIRSFSIGKINTLRSVKYLVTYLVSLGELSFKLFTPLMFGLETST